MTRKTAFFEGWSWFKFNNLGTNLKFYTSVVKLKELKLKVRGEKLVGGTFSTLLPTPILTRAKSNKMVYPYLWRISYRLQKERRNRCHKKKFGKSTSCTHWREKWTLTSFYILGLFQLLLTLRLKKIYSTMMYFLSELFSKVSG